MSSRHQHNHTVLVVEDDGLVRLDAAETLREAGFEVIEAGNANEALAEIAQRSDIELMFTDINMPGSMDGLELARRVHQFAPSIQLILTSGEVRPREDDIPDSGTFIGKPYSPETVTRAVARLLAA